jgi:hypothetical protein
MHLGATNAACKIIARGSGAGSLAGATCLHLGGVHPIDPYTDNQGLLQPDVGPHLDGVAVDHALDMGVDGPSKEAAARCCTQRPDALAISNTTASPGRAKARYSIMGCRTGDAITGSRMIQNGNKPKGISQKSEVMPLFSQSP